jgi:hypothetical protein
MFVRERTKNPYVKWNKVARQSNKRKKERASHTQGVVSNHYKENKKLSLPRETTSQKETWAEIFQEMECKSFD